MRLKTCNKNYIINQRLDKFETFVFIHKTSLVHFKFIQTFVFIIFLVFNSVIAASQNSHAQELINNEIENVIINANQIFKVEIITHKSDNIIITSSLEGEYKSSYSIGTKIIDETLEITLVKEPFIDIEDNKLSAHKVISASLKLEIPEDLNIAITSDIASVNLNGQFKDVSVNLTQGQCNFKGHVKSAGITTNNGHITIITSNALIIAASNHGKIEVDEFSSASSTWNLNSINGNIKVLKQ